MRVSGLAKALSERSCWAAVSLGTGDIFLQILSADETVGTPGKTNVNPKIDFLYFENAGRMWKISPFNIIISNEFYHILFY
jgi:hypothetical protein